MPQETQRLQQGVDSLLQQCRYTPARLYLVRRRACKTMAPVAHARFSILHSVVVNLVIESGVNWNRDERLFALFMMDPKVWGGALGFFFATMSFLVSMCITPSFDPFTSEFVYFSLCSVKIATKMSPGLRISW
jgi:hypothetical protein